LSTEEQIRCLAGDFVAKTNGKQKKLDEARDGE